MTKNKIELNFKLTDGTIQKVEASVGESVMQAAIFNNVDGIDAECGGSCMCATCHIYLSDELATLLDPASEDESEMLGEAAAERRETSRLSCQVHICEEMDGGVIEVPQCQS